MDYFLDSFNNRLAVDSSKEWEMFGLFSELFDFVLLSEEFDGSLSNGHNDLESLRKNRWSDQLHFDDFLGHISELVVVEENVEFLLFFLSSIVPLFLGVLSR